MLRHTKGEKTMRKIKKSLAVILAALMLASFLPLFASAAVTINRTNVKIVPPSVSPSVIEYGQTLAAVTLTGGECWYVDPDTGAETLVPGHFEVRSATTKPSPSDAYSIPLKFVSDDTANYTNISSLLERTANIKSGSWPKIKVNGLTATIAEAPTMTALTIQDTYIPYASSSQIVGGKVIDESGTEITNGTWKVTEYPEGIGQYTKLYNDIEVTLTWSATGYNPLTTKATINVLQKHPNYNIYAPAKLSIEGQSLTYSPDRTWADDDIIIPGIIKDKNDNDVPGKWEMRHSSGATTPMTYPIQATSSQSGAYIFFVPEDTTLPTYYFYGYYGPVAKADFALTEDSELVLNYGAFHKTPYTAQDNDFRFSTLKPTVDDIEITSIYWAKEIFDPQKADYGSVTLVEATISTSNKNYNSAKVLLPVRIQNFIHDENSLWYISSRNLQFAGSQEQSFDGIKEYKIDVYNKRLKGTINLMINGEVAVSVSPDENGHFYAEGEWTAPASGEYTYWFEYTPSEEDTATVTNPKTFEQKFTIELRPYHTLTVNVGENVYTFTERKGSVVYFDWRDETGLKLDDFGSWEFTDGNGNAYKPEKVDADDDDPTTTPSIYIRIQDDDIIATAKSASVIGDFDDNNSGLGGLWSFWQKLVNFIIEIYRTIVDFFVPAMEQI